jgi:hypothetical protein
MPHPRGIARRVSPEMEFAFGKRFAQNHKIRRAPCAPFARPFRRAHGRARVAKVRQTRPVCSARGFFCSTQEPRAGGGQSAL